MIQSIQGKSIKLDSAELESLFNFDFDVEDDISSLLPPTFEAISESDEVTDYQPETLNELSSTKARKFTNKVEFPSLPWKSFDYSKVEAAFKMLLS